MHDGVVLIVTELGSIELVGRSVNLSGIVHYGVVQTGTASNGHPFGDVPFQCSGEGVSVSCILEQLAVGDPPGVLDAGDELQGPELLHIAGIGIVSLINLVLGYIVSTWEKICRYKRVVIQTLDCRVALVLTHVACAHVESKLVLHELSGVAYREVVSVVGIVRDDTA